MQGKKIVKVIKSPIPFYASGISALFMSLVVLWTPLDGLAISTYLLMIGIACLVYAISSKIFKPEEIVTYETFTTQDELADQFIAEGEKFISQLNSLAEKIEKAEVKPQITRVIKALEGLIDIIAKQPSKARKLRKFYSYYLPTLTKVLQSYEQMEDAEVKGENLQASLTKIEEILQTVANAFEKQLDIMYRDDKVELTAEGQVLETLLSQQGLTEEK